MQGIDLSISRRNVANNCHMHLHALPLHVQPCATTVSQLAHWSGHFTGPMTKTLELPRTTPSEVLHATTRLDFFCAAMHRHNWPITLVVVPCNGSLDGRSSTAMNRHLEAPMLSFKVLLFWIMHPHFCWTPITFSHKCMHITFSMRYMCYAAHTFHMLHAFHIHLLTQYVNPIQTNSIQFGPIFDSVQWVQAKWPSGFRPNQPTVFNQVRGFRATPTHSNNPQVLGQTRPFIQSTESSPSVLQPPQTQPTGLANIHATTNHRHPSGVFW